MRVERSPDATRRRHPSPCAPLLKGAEKYRRIKQDLDALQAKSLSVEYMQGPVSGARRIETDRDRYMVEKKHAPLAYDATTITSNLVLLYNAQTQTRPTDHPRHDQPDACTALKPRNQPTN
eukprot:scaffold56206_cov74-Phaeocystis_antarctica.AAC.2